jgi:hypothetical protein
MIRFGGEKFSFLNILSIPLGYFGGRKLKKRILYFFVPFSTFHVTSYFFWNLEHEVQYN